MRLHLKGKPDFSMLNDKKVLEYREMINTLLCSYKGFDEEEILRKIWSDLKDESAERIVKMEETVHESVPESGIEKNNLGRLKKAFLRNRKMRT